MAENSNIEWTDHTFNPFIGCTKVSPGCDHCYAEHLMDTRMHKVVWGPRGERVRTSASTWRQPVRWNARHAEFFAAHGRRQRVFCASLADVFDNEVDLLWRRDLFQLIADTQNLDWLLLTKRIGNVPTMLRHIGVDKLPDNVWLGATVVNQAEADRDIPKLLAVPARVRFLSMEPLLGRVTLRNLPIGAHHEELHFPLEHDRFDALSVPNGINWVIAGGESGHGARPMRADWARSLRDQCAAAGVPFLFKQWGEWSAPGVSFPDEHPDRADEDELARFKVGKRAAGRLLDGRTHDEFPEAQ
ncbi:hypothetical protein WL45_15590 [Burkholderia ubonensis]|uniref:phage Gp37/Gp68 family protein n=1 Tax=Burkholderia ubonensis TaxID=101571 RepID=UPI00075A84D9|nr:phage Gp37/Gp68 family protein [Burkholderia ubonensis]KWB93960.1 hypothetical protein WL45_15590 [Burkholderia ubonensis]KWC17419.1 hypothetical protein WL46_26490 [Burkholderia ubonensis]